MFFSEELKICLKQAHIFVHKSGENIQTQPCQTLVELVNQLNQMVPNSIGKSTCFRKLLSNERKQLYGWSILE